MAGGMMRPWVESADEVWLHLRVLFHPRRYVLCAAWHGDDTCACGMYALRWEEEGDVEEEAVT